MRFRPLHDRIVVRRVGEEKKSAGGIIIPDTATEKPNMGEVISVGPGKRDEDGELIPLEVKKGDKILFGKWSGTEVKIDGQELIIMRESDVMMVVGGPHGPGGGPNERRPATMGRDSGPHSGGGGTSEDVLRPLGMRHNIMPSGPHGSGGGRDD